MEDLIERLVDDVALAGPKGLSATDLRGLLEKYHQGTNIPNEDQTANENEPPQSSITKTTVDDGVLDAAWEQLSKHSAIEVRHDRASSNADDKHAGERLSVTKERMWKTFTGHTANNEPIRHRQLECLQVIAAHGRNGILQGPLTKLTGHDKHSMPKRTDNMAASGYIAKRPVVVGHQWTSLLILKRYADEADQEDDERQVRRDQNGDAIIDYEQLFNKTVELLKQQPNNLMAVEDLQLGLGLPKTVNASETRSVLKLVDHLVKCGCFRKCSAKPSDKAGGALGKDIRCIQLLREPTADDRVVSRSQPSPNKPRRRHRRKGPHVAEASDNLSGDDGVQDDEVDEEEDDGVKDGLEDHKEGEDDAAAEDLPVDPTPPGAEGLVEAQDVDFGAKSATGKRKVAPAPTTTPRKRRKTLLTTSALPATSFLVQQPKQFIRPDATSEGAKPEFRSWCEVTAARIVHAEELREQHSVKPVPKMANRNAKRSPKAANDVGDESKRRESRITEVEAELLRRDRAGVYINPPGAHETKAQYKVGRGRPRKALIAVIKTDALKELPWFRDEREVNAPSGPAQTAEQTVTSTSTPTPTRKRKTMRQPPGGTQATPPTEIAPRQVSPPRVTMPAPTPRASARSSRAARLGDLPRPAVREPTTDDGCGLTAQHEAPFAPAVPVDTPPLGGDAKQVERPETFDKSHVQAHSGEDFYHVGNGRWKRGVRPPKQSRLDTPTGVTSHPQAAGQPSPERHDERRQAAAEVERDIQANREPVSRTPQRSSSLPPLPAATSASMEDSHPQAVDQARSRQHDERPQVAAEIEVDSKAPKETHAQIQQTTSPLSPPPTAASAVAGDSHPRAVDQAEPTRHDQRPRVAAEDEGESQAPKAPKDTHTPTQQTTNSPPPPPPAASVSVGDSQPSVEASLRTVSEGQVDAHPDENSIHRSAGRWRGGVPPSEPVNIQQPTSTLSAGMPPPPPVETFDKTYILTHREEQFHHVGNGRWKKGPKPAKRARGQATEAVQDTPAAGSPVRLVDSSQDLGLQKEREALREATTTPATEPTNMAEETMPTALARQGSVTASEPTLPTPEAATASAKPGSLPQTNAVGLARLRKEIVLSVIDEAGGIFPGNKESWRPLASRWEETYGETPGRQAFDKGVKGLVDSGKLVKTSFVFRSKDGTNETRSILTNPGIDVRSDAVERLKRAIVEAYPGPYLPESARMSDGSSPEPRATQALSVKQAGISTTAPPTLASSATASSATASSATASSVTASSATVSSATVLPVALPAATAPQTRTSPAAGAPPEVANSAAKQKSSADEYPSVEGLTVRRTSEGMKLVEASREYNRERQRNFQEGKKAPKVQWADDDDTENEVINEEEASMRGSFQVASYHHNNKHAFRERPNGKGRFSRILKLDGPSPRSKRPSQAIVTLKVPPAQLQLIGGSPMAECERLRLRPGQAFHPTSGTFGTEAQRFSFPQLPYSSSTQSSVRTSTRKRKVIDYAAAAIGAPILTDDDLSLGELLAQLQGNEPPPADSPQQKKQRLSLPQPEVTPNPKTFLSGVTYDKHYVQSHREDKFQHVGNGRWRRLTADEEIQRQERQRPQGFAPTAPAMMQPPLPEGASAPCFSRPLTATPQRGPGFARAAPANGHLKPPIPGPIPRQLTDPHSSALGADVSNSGRVRYQSRKRKEGLELEDLDTASPSQTTGQPPQKKQKAHFPNADVDDLVVAVALVKLLCGGLDQKRIQWEILAHALNYKHEAGAIRARYASLSKSRGKDIDSLQVALQQPFLTAYENDKLPRVDFQDLSATDWPALVEWAKGISVLPRRKQVRKTATSFNLPGAEADLQAFYDIDEPANPFKPDPRVYFDSTTDSMRSATSLKLIHGTSVNRSASSTDSTSDALMLLKSWYRAVVMTKEKNYDAAAAARKIGVFSDDIIQQASDELVEFGILNPERKDRQLPGRNFHLSKAMYKLFERWPIDSKTYLQNIANAYAEVTTHFVDHDEMHLSYHTKDADVVVLTNMVAQGQLKVVSTLPERNDDFDAPLPKLSIWGVDEISNLYNSHAIESASYRFPVVYEKTPSYSGGHNLRNVPPPMQAAQVHGEPGLRLPLWVDIHGNIVEDAWEMILRSLLHLLVYRPGSTAKAMEKAHDGKLWAWEIEMVLQWMEEVGVATSFGPGREVGGVWKGSWRASEWWYCVLAPEVATWRVPKGAAR